jgi:hypothetical protein
MYYEIWGHIVFKQEPEEVGKCYACGLTMYDYEATECETCGGKIHEGCKVECDCGREGCKRCMICDEEFCEWFCDVGSTGKLEDSDCRDNFLEEMRLIDAMYIDGFTYVGKRVEGEQTILEFRKGRCAVAAAYKEGKDGHRYFRKYTI